MAAVTVGTSATQLSSFSSSNRIIIQNLGSADIYMSDSPTVTTSNGIKIAAGGAFEFAGKMHETPAIYLISGSAGQDVRWMQVG